MAEVLPLQNDDQQTKQTPAENSTTSSQPAAATTKKTLPKGIILGPDGKPCRSCNSFRDFFSATSGGAAPPTAPTEAASRCPPDVEQLGRAGWTLLHTIAASYPSEANPAQQEDMKNFMSIFSRIYPCWSCAEDFRTWMSKPENDVRNVVQGRKTFGKWLCDAHNDVNVKLGKKPFDCLKWEERWRTGGKGC
ncbi:ERV/ALR sulfhydryl oxidase domain-containing protein [Pyronema omphalodes]|nr:ERV/ALR sulfhydryl oxidase domain-containing protein [Pyronema omphalodes]